MNETAALYEAIGGRAAVAAAVEDLYQRVLADPAIAHYFAAVDLARLMSHQRAFLGYVLGGPEVYDGRLMTDAHAGLAITDQAFDRVCQHLIETLRSLGVGEALTQRLAQNISTLRGQIVAP